MDTTDCVDRHLGRNKLLIRSILHLNETETILWDDSSAGRSVRLKVTFRLRKVAGSIPARPIMFLVFLGLNA